MSGDAAARHRIATEFATTFFVEAAAGTGKTTALVRRIVALLRAGVATLDRIVAVTFTEKAAGETKLRLRAEIEAARLDADAQERARLDVALEALELARIGTIHAFCIDLLHERPVEAGIDPLFAVASDPDAKAIADQAFNRWFETMLDDPPEGMRRILRRRGARNSAREQLRTAMTSLRQHRDFPQRWRRDAFDRKATIDGLMTELAAVGELMRLASASDTLVRNLAAIERFVADGTRLETVRSRDYDELEAALFGLSRLYSWRDRGRQRTRFGDLTRSEVLERRDRAKARLDAFVAASGADLAPLLHDELQEPIAQYERLKAETGKLDFLDLLIKTRDMIRDDGVVRGELQQRFTHFFIEEFQDTDPLQVEILLLLAADDSSVTDWRQTRPIAGKLFLVGDPKQSIYRFRRADIAIYEDVKARLLTGGATLLHLTRSFRSPPSIQAFVNGAFAPVMTAAPDRAQADYVPLEAARAEVESRPTLIALPVPSPYSEATGYITKTRVDESFPVLADPSCPATRGSPSRHVDGPRQLWVEPLCDLVPAELRDAEADELRREEAEAVRLTYVAVTRARDLLVLPVCGDQRLEGWLGTLDPMLYPTRDRGTCRPAPGCPAFGTDSVLDRGPKGGVPPGGPVSPGLHWPAAGAPPVIWWDPSRLMLEVDESVPLRLQHILRDDEVGAAAAGETAYEAWRDQRELVTTRASSPSVSVRSVTALAQAATSADGSAQVAAPFDTHDPDVRVELIEGRDEKRPGGRRFGSLVHAILANVELDADRRHIEIVAILQQRMLNATIVERDAAAAAVDLALRHPVLRAASSAVQVRRETPVFLTLDNGTLAEGVVDLAFRWARNGSDGWTVVDFKTDAEFSAEAEHYRRQVGLYVRAVQAATDLPVEGILLVV